MQHHVRARVVVGLAACLFLSLPSNASIPWGWGTNYFGEIGDGSMTTPRLSPVEVTSLHAVVAIAAGEEHSVALDADGNVWCWGWNYAGQIGDGTQNDRALPTKVTDLAACVAVGAGSNHTLAVAGNGTAWAWGRNNQGQLGDGTTTNRTRPVQVSGLSDVVAVAGGTGHSLALKADGTVWAWGDNGLGQLGDGTNTDRRTPVQVQGLTNIVRIAAGDNTSAAIRSDGTLWTWGNGPLGDGTLHHSNTPIQVPGLANVADVALGGYHGVAALQNGTVWTWGLNDYGQIGDGTTTDRLSPVQVAGLADAVDVGAGLYHSLVLRANGTVFSWGRNNVGQLGDGTMVDRLSPVQVLGLVGGVAAAAGLSHNFVLVRSPSALYVPDRTGTPTETVTLRAYLRRLIDNAWLPNQTVGFAIDGTEVGSAVTDTNGRAQYEWVIVDGPPFRTIGATFVGDPDYLPSSGNGTLICQTWATKMATFDRTQRITGRTELKCRLLRSDNVPLYNKTINFYVDGTFVIARPTNTQGYASYPYYDVPDGAGAGTRTILSEWPGNGGYAAISKTATLTVLKATPYIWVMSRSVPQGGTARLYAYFRRLYDYKKQEGKPVTFYVDGTWVADATTGSGSVDPGVARYNFDTTGLSVGTHTVRCEFAGDPWVDAGYGEGTLTIY